MHSAIYTGLVTHQRFKPVKHDFSYRLFMMYLDLDELDTLFESRRFWSVNKPNLASFRRHDHLGDPSESLKQSVSKLVSAQTGFNIEGSVRLLTHLRYWGYGFNPVSFYYCFDKTDRFVDVIVAEINNTPWSEQYCYVLSVKPLASDSQDLIPNRYSPEADRFHFEFSKQFHISPLMNMDMTHDWWFTKPQDRLMVHMNNQRDGNKLFTAHLELERRALTRQNLSKVLLHYPFMTGKVITAIYWQTLKTWLKGAPFYAHP